MHVTDHLWPCAIIKGNEPTKLGSVSTGILEHYYSESCNLIGQLEDGKLDHLVTCRSRGSNYIYIDLPMPSEEVSLYIVTST